MNGFTWRTIRPPPPLFNVSILDGWRHVRVPCLDEDTVQELLHSEPGFGESVIEIDVVAEEMQHSFAQAVAGPEVSLQQVRAVYSDTYDAVHPHRRSEWGQTEARDAIMGAEKVKRYGNWVVLVCGAVFWRRRAVKRQVMPVLGVVARSKATRWRMTALCFFLEHHGMPNIVRLIYTWLPEKAAKREDHWIGSEENICLFPTPGHRCKHCDCRCQQCDWNRNRRSGRSQWNNWSADWTDWSRFQRNSWTVTAIGSYRR